MISDILYRTAFDSEAPDVQFTPVRYESFFYTKVTFTGYIDIWSLDKNETSGKKVAFMAEPQIWYNFGTHLSLGSEIEVSLNFIPETEEIQIMPTLGFNW